LYPYSAAIQSGVTAEKEDKRLMESKTYASKCSLSWATKA